MGVDVSGAQTRTYIAYRARGEARHGFAGRGVHDVLGIGVTG